MPTDVAEKDPELPEKGCTSIVLSEWLRPGSRYSEVKSEFRGTMSWYLGPGPGFGFGHYFQNVHDCDK